jgi:hypothetical protein
MRKQDGMSKKKLVGVILACVIAMMVMIAVLPKPPTYTLAVGVSPSGAGSVSPSDGKYRYGTQVTLTASATNGYTFHHWGGDASGTSLTITITMNDDYEIIANFALEVLEIRDWYDLDAIRDNLGGTYVLMNDLDPSTAGYMELASETANWGWGWEPIGSLLGDEFTGSLDGQGYEIRDLFINRPDGSYVGLFGAIDDQGIIDNIRVVRTTLTGGHDVGSLVGHNRGTVSESCTAGTVTSVTFDDSDVGGLVGVNYGTVSNSYSSGSITGNGDVGGLVGNNLGTVSGSYSTASVTGHSHVGGLVGLNDDGTVSESCASGNVTGYEDVGGLVGLNYGTVSSSYSSGSVTANHFYVGGLVAFNYDGTVSNSFWDIQTSGQITSAGGTGGTTAQMKNITTFSHAGWNIIAVANPSARNLSYIWNIVDGVTYPFLSSQPIS